MPSTIEPKTLLYRFEGFEIYDQGCGQYLYLYGSNANDLAFYRLEEQIVNRLRGQLPVLNPVERICSQGRPGFIFYAENPAVMAESIRDDQNNLSTYAKRLAKLMVSLHKAEVQIDSAETAAVFRNKLGAINSLPDFKDGLMTLFDGIRFSAVPCHLDLGAYHVLVTGSTAEAEQNDIVIGWHSFSYGDPMADLAKTVFWSCSDYMPGIGAYLLTDASKREFVKSFLHAYQAELPIENSRLIQWLVILAAIEFNTEYPLEGMTKDLANLRKMIELYLKGQTFDYLDYLIWFA